MIRQHHVSMLFIGALASLAFHANLDAQPYPVQAYRGPFGGYAFVCSSVRSFDGFTSVDGYLPACWSSLLEFPAYQAELQLTPSQRKAIEDGLRRASTAIGEIYHDRSGGSKQERFLNCLAANKLQMTALIREQLSPKQQLRFEQLKLQVRLRVRGLKELNDDNRLSPELLLSDAQLKEIRAAERSLRRQLVEQGERHLTQLHTECLDRTLTASQHQRLQALCGKPLSVSVLVDDPVRFAGCLPYVASRVSPLGFDEPTFSQLGLEGQAYEDAGALLLKSQKEWQRLQLLRDPWNRQEAIQEAQVRLDEQLLDAIGQQSHDRLQQVRRRLALRIRGLRELSRLCDFAPLELRDDQKQQLREAQPQLASKFRHKLIQVATELQYQAIADAVGPETARAFSEAVGKPFYPAANRPTLSTVEPLTAMN